MALLLLLLAWAPAFGAGTQYLEAEDALLTGPTVSTSWEGFRGSGFADYGETADESIEWTFDIETAGIYDLSFRYALAAGARPLQVSVNGSPTTQVAFDATGAFDTWEYTARLEALLVEGTNTVVATAVGNFGPNVDLLRVSVLVNPSDIVSHQAEDAFLDGPVVSTEHAGYQGTGFADYGDTLGEYIEWTIDVDDAGLYALEFRYALADSDRPLVITINVDDDFVVEFPPTDAWSDWRLTEPLELDLEAGENVIRATAETSVGANIDSLVVTLLCLAEETNFAPTDIDLDGTEVLEFDEGAVIGNLTATDPNPEDLLTFSVDDERFEVVADQLKLVAGESLDAELEPTVTVEITATDPGGLTITESFDITVIELSPFCEVLEAEDARLRRARVMCWIPGYTGSGYVRFARWRQGKIKWTVFAPEAGDYQLTFRYAARHGSFLRPIVNGRSLRPRWRFFPRSRCTVWRTVDMTVSLDKGKNGIALTTVTRSRPLIDSLTVKEAE